MKKVIKLVIALFVVNILSTSYPQALLITKLSKNSEVVNIVDKVIKEENKKLKIDVTIPQISSKSNDEFVKNINNNIINNTNSWLEEVKKATNEYFDTNEEPVAPFEAYGKYTIGENLGGIISLYIDYYEYIGGAHGVTNRKTYNIDLNNKKELSLKDLFIKDYDYKALINNYINVEINKNKDKYFTGKEGFNGINDEQSYYIKDNKLVIVFQEYEIAPYSAGIVEFPIDFHNFKTVFLYDKIISN